MYFQKEKKNNKHYSNKVTPNSHRRVYAFRVKCVRFVTCKDSLCVFFYKNYVKNLCRFFIGARDVLVKFVKLPNKI